MKTSLKIEISDEMAKFIKIFAEKTNQDPKDVIEKFLTAGLNSGATSIKETLEKGRDNYIEMLKAVKHAEKYKIDKIPTYREVEQSMQKYTSESPLKEWEQDEVEKLRREYEQDK